MKKLFALVLVGLLVFINCNKEETTYSGTLKITFKSLRLIDYSKIKVIIYSFDEPELSLVNSSPDTKGTFTKKLLAGNYRLRISSVYKSDERGFQIINGETINIEYNLSEK